MTNNQILNRIDSLCDEIRHHSTVLKEIQYKLMFESKMTPEILLDIQMEKSTINIEGDDMRNRLGFIDLPVTGLICEPSVIMTNLSWRAETALSDEQEGKDSKWISVWLSDAISRFSEICNELSEYVKNERTEQHGNALTETPHPTTPELEMLNWFNDEYPKVCSVRDYKQHDIKTRRGYVEYLKREGLIEPDDRDKGFIITNKGREYINEHFS